MKANDRASARRRDRPGGDGRGASACSRRWRRRRGHPFTLHASGSSAAARSTRTAPRSRDEVLAACQAADAVLLGAVGGPKWDDPQAKVRPEQGLLGAAQGAGRLRQPAPGAASTRRWSTPRRSRPERLAGVDILVVRELTGGLYFGEPQGPRAARTATSAPSTRSSTPTTRSGASCELAFRLAQRRRKKVTSVDKANVLESSRLWRQVATRGRRGVPGRARSSTCWSTRPRCAW